MTIMSLLKNILYDAKDMLRTDIYRVG